MTESIIIALALAMLIMPLIVGFWLRRRQIGSWHQFSVGALTLVFATVIGEFIWGAMLNALPLPTAIVFPLFWLSGAALQVGVLYAAFHYYLSDIQTEREALMVGAGRVAASMILVGMSLGISHLSVIQLGDTDLNTLDKTEEQVGEIQESLDDYWAGSPWQQLAQALQSTLDFPIQLIISVLVLLAWRLRNWRMLGIAVSTHLALVVAGVIGLILLGLIGWAIATLAFDIFVLRFYRQRRDLVQQALNPQPVKKRKIRKRKDS